MPSCLEDVKLEAHTEAMVPTELDSELLPQGLILDPDFSREKNLAEWFVSRARLPRICIDEAVETHPGQKAVIGQRRPRPNLRPEGRLEIHSKEPRLGAVVELEMGLFRVRAKQAEAGRIAVVVERGRVERGAVAAGEPGKGEPLARPQLP